MMTAEINNSRSKLLMFWSSCSAKSFFSFLFLVNGFVPRLHALSYELTTCVSAPSAGYERTMSFSGSNIWIFIKSDEA